ncbi:MAG: hypothetical protein IPO21_00315 [Bacteroidales bacterium]|nr:hypothetical protein [Bacteroidales bacterium]
MSTCKRYTIGTTYRFGYQGQFAEYDFETGYNHFEARLYNPRIGRWLSTDPAGQYWSPYLAMGNIWMNGVDRDGRYSGRYSDGYQDKNGNNIWIDGETAATIKINGVTFTNWTSSRETFNFWSGGFDKFIYLSEITISGKYSDHMRTMNSPVVKAMRGKYRPTFKVFQIGFGGNITPGMGFGFETGVIFDERGNWDFYFTGDHTAGADVGYGISLTGSSSYNPTFGIADVKGKGASDNLSFLGISISRGGDKTNPNCSFSDYGKSYTSTSVSISRGPAPFGFTRNNGNTW